MADEQDGMEREEPGMDYQEFLRAMEALGPEGLGRIIEHLTGLIEADPEDADSLSIQGLAYEQVGEHLRAAEDYGRVIALDPGNAEAHLSRARVYGQLDELRLAVADYDAASGWPPATPRPTWPGEAARRSWATWLGRSATSTWPSCWTRRALAATTTGG